MDNDKKYAKGAYHRSSRNLAQACFNYIGTYRKLPEDVAEALNGYICMKDSATISETEHVAIVERLVYVCAKHIMCNVIDALSKIGDAVLNYIGIGFRGNHDNAPQWVEEYEIKNNIPA